MTYIAGVDEVGRGCLAGPVMAAAVILPPGVHIPNIKDSKKLSVIQREKIYKVISQKALSIGIGMVDSKTIDKINIREATFNAMDMAVQSLTVKPDKALIDGFSVDKLSVPNEGIIKGDNIEISIMAASIIAKVTRDKLMKNYDLIFSEYLLKNNKGYGTSAHLKALIKYKASILHRKTFKPVFNNLPNHKWLSQENRFYWFGSKVAGLYLLNSGYKLKSIIKGDVEGSVLYIGIKSKITIIFLVFTKLNLMGSVFQRPTVNNIKYLDENVMCKLNGIIDKENYFRFDALNVNLSFKSPKIDQIKNIDYNQFLDQ